MVVVLSSFAMEGKFFFFYAWLSLLSSPGSDCREKESRSGSQRSNLNFPGSRDLSVVWKHFFFSLLDFLPCRCCQLWCPIFPALRSRLGFSRPPSTLPLLALASLRINEIPHFYNWQDGRSLVWSLFLFWSHATLAKYDKYAWGIRPVH